MPFCFQRATRLALFALAVLPCFALAQQSSDLVSRILQLNRRLDILQRRRSSARTAFPVTAIAAIARTRQSLLVELLNVDPTAARTVLLSSEQAASFVDNYPDLAGLMESAGEWSGTLEQTVEDDFAHGTSKTHWLLHTPEDRRIELSFSDAKDRTGLPEFVAALPQLGLLGESEVSHCKTSNIQPSQTHTHAEVGLSVLTVLYNSPVTLGGLPTPCQRHGQI